MKHMITIALMATSLTGCANLSATQQANLSMELSLAQQLGLDATKVWCATSGVIYVIANSETSNKSHPSKAVKILRDNANTAAIACPMIEKITGVKATNYIPTNAVLSPVTP